MNALVRTSVSLAGLALPVASSIGSQRHAMVAVPLSPASRRGCTSVRRTGTAAVLRRDNALSFGPLSRLHRRVASVIARAAGDAEESISESSAVTVDTAGAPGVWYGRALLIFVAAAYGSLSVAFKYVYSLPGPPSAGTIGAVRGVIAALCFIPMIMNAKKGEQEAGSMNINTEEGKKKFWLAAGELALWNLLAQGCCNVALLFTDATRVSFLTQASIAFTPVLCVMTGDRVAGITWVGCLLALAGVVALGFDGGGSAAAAAQSIGLNLGDIIALIGAAAYSLYIFRIGAFAKMKLPGNLTQAWKTVILAVLYCVWAAADAIKYATAAPGTVAAPWAGWTNPLAWGVLAFTAIVPGYLADVCQAKGQESVSASESQVLLAGEPLFAAVFGLVLLGETLGFMGLVGGAGLVVGAILCGVDDGSGKSD